MNTSDYSTFYTRLLKSASAYRFDFLTPICLLILGTLGVVFIYSAQVYSGQSQYVMQIVWLVVGASAYLTVAFIDYKFFLKISHWVYLLALVLLLLLFTPLGEARGGSLRWLDFRFFSVQPSETAKIAILVMVASILARSEIGTLKDSFLVLVKITGAVGIPLYLVLTQPDLGSALVVPPLVFSLLYVSKLSRNFFATAFFVFLFIVGVLSIDTYRYNLYLDNNGLTPAEARGQYQARSWVPLKDYQRNRILAFVANEKVDPMGIGWNLRQSLISVGSGGLTGKGWTEGTQAKLGYLPRGVAHNDFIFSVLAEETGFLGSGLVVALFGLVLWNGIRIAGLARDRFGMLLALGVTVIFAVHVFINIGMTIGLMPITGLPLPFLSYGGSFLLSCCVLQGFVQSVYRYRRDFS